MIKVGVVTSNLALRLGLREVINNQPDLCVPGVSEDFDQVLADMVDVLVIVKQGNHQPGQVSKPVLYLIDDPADLQHVFSQNTPTWGALSAGASESEINIAIRALAEGLWIGAPALMQKWFPRPTSRSNAETDLPSQVLTLRETEVLQLAAQGLANKQIANQLGVSDHTIKFHLSSIYAKLNASSRTEAVRAGVRSGLVVL